MRRLCTALLLVAPAVVDGRAYAKPAVHARSTMSHRAPVPLPGAEPAPGAPRPPGKPRHKARTQVVVQRPAELVAINTHETFELRPSSKGDLSRQTMRGLARFLRCHHTQRMHAMSERLAQLLYTTAKHFDFARLEVVAGYRAPAIAKEKGNPKSPHKKGLACDFRVVGIPNETLRDYARTLPRTGVGYYPNSGFVHLDSRDGKSAFWIDYSRPGERAKYEKPETVGERGPEGPDPQGDESPGVLAPDFPAPEPATSRKDD